MQPFHSTPDFLWRALLALSLATFAGLIAFFGWQTRPVPLHDLHLADGEKLQCVSWSPFHRPGQTPFDPTLRIPREQIAADLAALSRITRCVRLYSVDQGLDAALPVARELGLKVLLGAWIGADTERNAVELDRAIALANEYADVVDALIVGNEVLLRRERTPEEMRDLLAYARQRVKVPVTYADVWEFWMRNRQLADEVDLVTVHILPFWEDQPVGVEAALEHVGQVFGEVRAAFGKPVMIGETGWPGAGRQREESRPSRVNQARYVREFIHRAHQEGWRYNLIEAIDQPWKRAQEGTAGGFWGMLDPALKPRFPLSGPVAERDSLVGPLLGGLSGLLLCATLVRRTGPATRARRMAACAMGLVGGIVTVLHAEHALLAYRDALEWSVLGAVALLGAALPPLLSCWNGEGQLPGAARAWQAVRGRIVLPAPLALLGLARGVLLFACAVAALLLAVDPRYRDFPVWLYLLPALYLGLTGWLAAEHGNEERLCSLVIVVAVTLRWLPEPANPQAIAWLLTGLAFGLPALFARQHKQGGQGSHGGGVGAVKH